MLSFRYLLHGCKRTHGDGYPLMALSRDRKVLASLLLVFVFCDFLLSPLGFETRGSAILGSASSRPWLVLLFGGLILNIVSLIIVFSRPRPAAVLSSVGSLGYIALALADQAGLVTPLRPPAAISAVEVVTTLVLLGVIVISSRIYRETSPQVLGSS